MPLPSSPDLDRHTRDALDALLVLAGAIQERRARAPEHLAELRSCIRRLLRAAELALPDAELAPLELEPDEAAHLAIGRIVGALWRLEVDVLARELARLGAVLDGLDGPWAAG